MRPLPVIVAALLVPAAYLSAQPAPPSLRQMAELRALAQVHARDVTPLSVDSGSREEVRQFYRAVYPASDNVPMDWTGSYTTGDAGDTSAAYKAAVLLRINFFRALAGVPATVALNSTFSVKDQQAALMMSANNTLQHTGIPTSWTFYTADGADAAANSNLALGSSGPDSISGYMIDGGANNTIAGHRRWLIYPQTQEMGTGDVPGNASFYSANAVWVIDSNYGGPRPATRTTGIAYPPAGYVPYTLVPQRWSFSYPNANFSSATVTAMQGNQSIAVTSALASNSGIGEPAIVFVLSGHDANSNDPFDRPGADTTYTINLTNVLVSNVAQNFSYTVTVFDPDVAGNDFVPVTVSGSATPSVGVSNGYTITKPQPALSTEGSLDLQWRALQLAAFAKTYNAEAGLDGIAASTAGDYSVVQSSVVGAGTASYHLAQTSSADQTLTLPDTFYVNGSDSALSFLSRLGWATSIQVAHAQVSTDDGSSWTDIYSQAGAGNNTAGETSFTTRTASLADYSGRTIRVRFAFTIPGSGSWFNQSDPGVGWYLDNISLTDVQGATTGDPASTGGATSFSYTPASTGSFGLQGRGVLFGTYPLEWGPIKLVTAVTATSFTTQPAGQSVAHGGSVSLTATASGSPTYQWQLDGLDLSGKTSSSLALTNLTAADSGLYTVVANGGAATSVPAIVGVLTTLAVVDDGTVVATSIQHPNGKLYDQIVLTGPAAAISTQGGRTTRTSFIDENNNIVQVEFAGAGTLSLVLDDPSGPANPTNYNQNFAYMKGHVGLVVAGADETTNLLVFTVGRATAFDPTGHYNILQAPTTPGGGGANDPATNGSPLFNSTHNGGDGFAGISFIAIASTDGKFGGLRASNARFTAINGYTGVYAPNIDFAGPVFVSDIDAGGDATPVIIVGSVSDARVTGGNLHQTNGVPVQVSGLTQLKFQAGSGSDGTLYPAQQNQAVLEENGVDVTSQIVVNP